MRVAFMLRKADREMRHTWFLNCYLTVQGTHEEWMCKHSNLDCEFDESDYQS